LLVQVDVEVLGDVVSKFGEKLPTKHVAFALDLDLLLLFDVLEARVFVAPALSLEKVNLDVAIWVMVDNLSVSLSIDSNFLFRNNSLAIASELVVHCS